MTINKRSRLTKVIMGVILIIVYVAADFIMDKILFPMLSESLKEHHIEIVSRYMILLNLVWVWLIGYICSTYIFKSRENKLVKLTIIVFGSALVATIVFSFISLPLIWIAYAVPLLAPICLFFHDYGLFVYFVIMILIFSYRYFKKTSQ
jgi:hypothetical protein